MIVCCVLLREKHFLKAFLKSGKILSNYDSTTCLTLQDEYLVMCNESIEPKSSSMSDNYLTKNIKSLEHSGSLPISATKDLASDYNEHTKRISLKKRFSACNLNRYMFYWRLTLAVFYVL